MNLFGAKKAVPLWPDATPPIQDTPETRAYNTWRNDRNALTNQINNIQSRINALNKDPDKSLREEAKRQNGNNQNDFPIPKSIIDLSTYLSTPPPLPISSNLMDAYFNEALSTTPSPLQEKSDKVKKFLVDKIDEIQKQIQTNPLVKIFRDTRAKREEDFSKRMDEEKKIIYTVSEVVYKMIKDFIAHAERQDLWPSLDPDFTIDGEKTADRINSSKVHFRRRNDIKVSMTPIMELSVPKLDPWTKEPDNNCLPNELPAFYRQNDRVDDYLHAKWTCKVVFHSTELKRYYGFKIGVNHLGEFIMHPDSDDRHKPSIKPQVAEHQTKLFNCVFYKFYRPEVFGKDRTDESKNSTLKDVGPIYDKYLKRPAIPTNPQTLNEMPLRDFFKAHVLEAATSLVW
jgi:Txe/YoeB family toxin of Txe-Axe toxin-antitoxin module